MNTLTRLYVRMTESKGQAMPEYAVIVAVIIVAALAAFQALGGQISTTLTTVTDAMKAA